MNLEDGKDLLVHLRKEARFYRWLTTPAANAQPKMYPTWLNNAALFDSWAAFTEQALLSASKKSVDDLPRPQS